MKVKLRIRGDREDIEVFCKILGRIFSIDALTPILPSDPEAGCHRFLELSFSKEESL